MGAEGSSKMMSMLAYMLAFCAHNSLHLGRVICTPTALFCVHNLYRRQSKVKHAYIAHENEMNRKTKEELLVIIIQFFSQQALSRFIELIRWGLIENRKTSEKLKNRVKCKKIS